MMRTLYLWRSPAGRALFASLLTALVPSVASAQQVLSHDTIAGDTNVAITCGFCANEKIGVIFRELSTPRNGLEPSDFPIEVEGVQVALANAQISMLGACVGAVDAATIDVSIEIWAGIEPVEGDGLDEMPVEGPWGGPDNEMLLVQSVTPVTLSTADAPGSMRYEAQFNELALIEEDGRALRVEAPYKYLRVVVTLMGGRGESPPCEAGGFEAPGGFPIRDDDGVIQANRSFFYASGVGWIWNDDERPMFHINGDWAIRIEYNSAGSGTRDGGSTPDASIRRDATIFDSGDGGPDGGSGDDDDDCSCAVPGAKPPTESDRGWALLAFAAGLCAVRRRRR